MLVDTHSHLYEQSFRDDWNEVLGRCKEAGVEKIMLPNVDTSTIEDLHAIVEGNPDLFYPMMGLHPCSVKENYQSELELIKDKLFQGKYVAVGEIGIDLYWDKTFEKQQEEVFLTQVGWANELGLPISIHSRESTGVIIKLLKDKLNCESKGIFHCFSGTLEEGKTIVEMGYYLGIGGVVTFKNSNLGSILKELGPERLVLETDAPYLAPHPHRGKRNESSYTKLVAEKLASIFEITPKEIADITTQNAKTIFKFT